MERVKNQNALKPLARWTVGNVNRQGIAALYESVRSFTGLYGDRFDKLVCFNNLSAEQINTVAALGVLMLPQYPNALPRQPQSVMWKLYPPRVRQNSHELLIDNDLVLFDRLPEIEEFLASHDLAVITAGLTRSFGWYDHLVPEKVQMNSGLVGWPPGFDLAAAVQERLRINPNPEWTDKFDEQGLVASVITQMKHLVVPLSKVGICHQLDFDLPGQPENVPPPGVLPPATHGYHFVELNVGNDLAWKTYQKSRMRMT